MYLENSQKFLKKSLESLRKSPESPQKVLRKLSENHQTVLRKSSESTNKVSRNYYLNCLPIPKALHFEARWILAFAQKGNRFFFAEILTCLAENFTSWKSIFKYLDKISLESKLRKKILSPFLHSVQHYLENMVVIFSKIFILNFFFHYFAQITFKKLDEVGPVDNRSSTNKLHHLVKK